MGTPTPRPIPNADPPGDVIALSVNGTINLTGALPDISNSMTINGPGSDKLTVRRDTGGVYRILTIKSGATVMLSGFTISNGVAPAGPAGTNGGGGLFNSGALTTNDFNVSGNSTADAPAGSATPVCPGGGIYNEGALAMTFSAVFGNSTRKAARAATAAASTTSTTAFTPRSRPSPPAASTATGLAAAASFKARAAA